MRWLSEDLKHLQPIQVMSHSLTFLEYFKETLSYSANCDAPTTELQHPKGRHHAKQKSLSAAFNLPGMFDLSLKDSRYN